MSWTLTRERTAEMRRRGRRKTGEVLDAQAQREKDLKALRDKLRRKLVPDNRH